MAQHPWSWRRAAGCAAMVASAVALVSCNHATSGASSVGRNFGGSWQQTSTLTSSSCGGTLGQQVVEYVDYVQSGRALEVAGGVTGVVIAGRATWSTTQIAASVRRTRAASLDLAADGNSYTGTFQDDVLDQTSTPPAGCSETWSVSAVRLAPTDFTGVWGLRFTTTASTCGLPLGTVLDDHASFVRIGGEVLVGPGNAVVLAGRAMSWSVQQIEGSKTTTLDASVAMQAGDQAFSGTASRRVVDPTATPPLDCTDDFDLSGVRGALPGQVELRDYFPMQDQDVYVYDDGSTIGVSNDNATPNPEIELAIVPWRSAPALGLQLRQADGGEFDLTALHISAVLPPTSASTDVEVYYVSNAGLVPAPLLGLLPALVPAGASMTSRRADHVLGFVGGGGTPGYFGTSTWSVNFDRSSAVGTPLGTFPDVIRLAASEKWRKDQSLSMAATGRLSHNTNLVLWLARGFGPVAFDLEGRRHMLAAATIGGFEL